MSTEDCDYKILSSALEKAGWLQFSFVNDFDQAYLVAGLAQTSGSNFRWIVITHSCDLVHHTDQEPHVELLEVEVLSMVPDDSLGRQSPRTIVIDGRTGVGQPIYLRARAARRIFVPRDRFRTIKPDDAISIRSPNDLNGVRGASEIRLSEWLANRYRRGWTPTEFDRRISIASKFRKIQGSLKRLNSLGVEDILLRVTPTSELARGESYEVTLMILVSPAYESHRPAIAAEAMALGGYIQQPEAISVVGSPAVHLTTEISYESVKGWNSFTDVFRDALAFQE